MTYFELTASGRPSVNVNSLPADFKKICHPIITCAVTADLAAFIYGKVTGVGFEGALSNFKSEFFLLLEYMCLLLLFNERNLCFSFMDCFVVRYLTLAFVCLSVSPWQSIT